MVSLAAILAIVSLMVSCYQPPQNPNPPPPPESEKPAPGQTTTEDTAVKEPYNDLSDYIDRDPAEVDNSNLPITPVEKLHITGSAPQVDIATYRLTVDGLVNNPLTLTYYEIKRYPTITATVLLICPEFFADNAEWTGVPLATILAEAGIMPQARRVIFHALDDYTEKLSLEDLQGDGVFLAYLVNGQVLPKEHGYPLRLIVKGKYGGHWIKWLKRLEIQ